MKSLDENKILVVGPSWVGDMVMAQSLFITLKRLNPDTTIDVLAPRWSFPLLERMPQVHEAMDMPVGHGAMAIGQRRNLGKALRPRRYGQAIVLPNSFKSALIPWFAHIPLRTGWRGEMRYGLLDDIRRLDKKTHPLLVQRFNALAYPEGEMLPAEQPAPVLKTDPGSARPLLEGLSLNTHRKVLALCPGAAFGPAKCWPAHHYAHVAGVRIQEGWQVWLMGSAQDRAVAERIAGALPEAARPHCKTLAGATELAQAIDLLALTDAVVSNDSGLMHIAAALGRPLVVLYGSTSPDFTPPLHEKTRENTTVILSHSVVCGPCFRRRCSMLHSGNHPGEYPKCLEDLRPERVLDALARIEERRAE